MSNIAKSVGYGVGFIITGLIVSAIVIAILAVVTGYLLPLATAGAVAPGFAQSLAIVATALVTRAVLFGGNK